MSRVTNQLTSENPTYQKTMLTSFGLSPSKSEVAVSNILVDISGNLDLSSEQPVINTYYLDPNSLL